MKFIKYLIASFGQRSITLNTCPTNVRGSDLVSFLRNFALDFPLTCLDLRSVAVILSKLLGYGKLEPKCNIKTLTVPDITDVDRDIVILREDWLAVRLQK